MYRTVKAPPRLIHQHLVLACFVLGLAMVACFPSVDPNAGYKNFQTAVAKAPQDGYTMYWLGRSFTAGGLAFEGPSVNDWGAEVEGGGITFAYDARIPGDGGVSLDITLYSRAAWLISPTQTPRLERGATRQETPITVAGLSGTFQVVRVQYPGLAARRYLRLRLVAPDGTVIVASTATGGSATPYVPGIGGSVWSDTERRFVTATAVPSGPDVNPLADDDQTFLSVMQQLRRYPQ